MTIPIVPTLSILPTDILVVVFELLSVEDLYALALACRYLHFAVHNLGWTTYMLANPRFAPSIVNVLSMWDAHSQVRYHALSDEAWSNEEFVARPIPPPWRGQLQPLLAISTTRLVVAAGHVLYSYVFAHPFSLGGSPRIQFEASYTLHQFHEGRKDVTGLAFAADGGLGRTLYVGFRDGSIERVILPLSPPSFDAPFGVEVPNTNKVVYDIHGGDLIQSLSSQGDLLLSLSLNGLAVISNVSNPETPSSHAIELQTRGWSTYLSTKSRVPYAAFGTSSIIPLCIYNINNSHLSPIPSAILGQRDIMRTTSKPTAVYGICGSPPSAHWGSDQVVVSGWYDGVVRVHDLRSSSRAIETPETLSSSSPAPLLPVMAFHDPWSYEPIYTVASGGGSSNHIAAGSARHSVVSFWDVRYPTRGWSVHAPGNDPSPVYSIILESSRLFGATQSRPFVYDFGPGVTEDTYPALPIRLTRDRRLKYKPDKHGFHVTKYSHKRSSHRPKTIV